MYVSRRSDDDGDIGVDLRVHGPLGCGSGPEQSATPDRSGSVRVRAGSRGWVSVRTCSGRTTANDAVQPRTILFNAQSDNGCRSHNPSPSVVTDSGRRLTARHRHCHHRQRGPLGGARAAVRWTTDRTCGPDVCRTASHIGITKPACRLENRRSKTLNLGPISRLRVDARRSLPAPRAASPTYRGEVGPARLAVSRKKSWPLPA